MINPFKLMGKDLKMLRPSLLGLSFALFFCCPAAHAESTANKCTDGKQITYANMPCEKLGLKTIGPVKKSITVIPAISESEKNPPENPDQKDGEKNDTSGTEKAGPLKSLIKEIIH
jgi:hypothetical protein